MAGVWGMPPEKPLGRVGGRNYTSLFTSPITSSCFATPKPKDGKLEKFRLRNTPPPRIWRLKPHKGEAMLERFKVPHGDEVRVPEDSLRETVTAVFEKMGVNTRQEAAVLASESGLIEHEGDNTQS